VLRSQSADVVCLISMISQNSYSYMLHTPNIKIAQLSAKALDIPIMFGSTQGEKEEELNDILETLVQARDKYNFTALASGGLSSNYQRSRLENIAIRSGLTSINPLWGIDQREYLKSLVQKGYNFILTSVSSAGLDDKWLGKSIDETSVGKILYLADKYRFNPAFEGGEAETLVLDCPLFRKEKIQIIDAKKIWDGVSGTLVIEKAQLVAKRNS
jgi:diphthine-ammonia ligase